MKHPGTACDRTRRSANPVLSRVAAIVLSSICLAGVGRADGPPGERDFRAAQQAIQLRGGLALVAGDAEDVHTQSLAVSLPHLLVLSLTPGVPAADQLRSRLESTDLLGRVVVQPVFDPRLPLVSHAAAIVVVDADALGDAAPTDEEIRRVLRPLGRAWVRRKAVWTSFAAPWPESFGDCGHFYVDAGNSDVSSDTAVGEPRTIRWNTGRGNTLGKQGGGATGIGLRIAGGVLVTTEQPTGGAGRGASALVGFDAFSGVPLWRRQDLTCELRWSIVMDRERVVLWPSANHLARARTGYGKHLQAVDPRTGETLLTYTNGPALNQPLRTNNWVPFLLLHKGRLIIGHDNTLWVLNAADGALVWKRSFDAKAVGWPSVAGDRLLCTVGDRLADGSGSAEVYYHIDRIEAFDLADGNPAWTWLPGDRVNPAEQHIALDVSATASEVLVVLQETSAGRYHHRGKNQITHLIRIHPATGREQWRTRYQPDGNRPVFRALPVADKIFNSVSMRHTLFNRATGAQIMNPAGGPLWTTNATGCAPYRGAASGYVFRSLYTFRAQDNALKVGRAMAAFCQIGSFPAHGMLLVGSTHCSCVPYIQGMAAFSADAPPPEHRGQRLFPAEAITASAPAKPDSHAESSQPQAAWPMSFHDARRSSWTDSQPPAAPGLAWSVRLAKPAADSLLQQTAIAHHPFADLITGPTISNDGTVLVALPHQHRVMALDLQSGKLRWSYTADARVDSAPTIDGSIVLFGTRGGWIHALDRSSGKLLWKHMAAPTQQFRVQSGQIESVWPLNGTVLVHENRIYAVAGTHSQLDGGFQWVELDRSDGRLLRSGQWNGESPWLQQPGPRSPRWIDVEGREEFINFDSAAYDNQTWDTIAATPESILNPLVLSPDAKRLMMGAFGIDRQDARELRWARDFLRNASSHQSGFSARPHWPDFLQPIDGGLLSIVNAGAGYCGVKAKAIAHRGGDFVGMHASNPAIGMFGGQRETLIRFRISEDLRPPADTPGRTLPNRAELVWTAGRVHARDGIYRMQADRQSAPAALVKAAEQVLVADGRALARYAWNDGKHLGNLPLPDRAVEAGIAVIPGWILVATVDGTISAWK